MTRRKPELHYLLAKAVEIAVARRFSASDSKYSAAAAAAPRDERGRCGLALAHMDMGRPGWVIDDMEAVLRARPGAAYPHGVIGMAMQEAGRWREALASYESMISADPSEASARAKKAQLLLVLGERGAATEAAADLAGTPLSGREYPREAARLRAVSADASVGRPPRFRSDDDAFILPGLRELLDMAVGPEVPGCPDLDGIIAAGATDLGAAAARADRELAARPGSVEALLAKGAVMADAGEAAGAAACYDAALGIEPGNMRAHSAKAVAIHDGGDLEGALECLGSACRARPTGRNSAHTRKILRAWRDRLAAGRPAQPPFGPFMNALAVGRWTATRRLGLGPAGREQWEEAARSPRQPVGRPAMFPKGLLDGGKPGGRWSPSGRDYVPEGLEYEPAGFRALREMSEAESSEPEGELDRIFSPRPKQRAKPRAKRARLRPGRRR